MSVAVTLDIVCVGAGLSALGGRSSFIDRGSVDNIASSEGVLIASNSKHLKRSVFTEDVGDDTGRSLVRSLSLFNSSFGSVKESRLVAPGQTGQNSLVVGSGFVLALVRVVMGETGRRRRLSINRASLVIDHGSLDIGPEIFRKSLNFFYKRPEGRQQEPEVPESRWVGNWRCCVAAV
ncbi:hypothetical protein FVER53590_25930 [Fusarium verticillioides]|nr:hypothetical protein FVER53590_25930 [Fusarium verticillioides]